MQAGEIRAGIPADAGCGATSRTQGCLRTCPRALQDGSIPGRQMEYRFRSVDVLPHSPQDKCYSQLQQVDGQSAGIPPLRAGKLAAGTNPARQQETRSRQSRHQGQHRNSGQHRGPAERVRTAAGSVHGERVSVCHPEAVLVSRRAQAGLMLWFSRNRFSGSYSRLILASRA